MYKLVSNKEENKLFGNIFKSSFQKKHYELEEFEGEKFDFLVENDCGEYAGTVEFVPYKPGTGITTVEDMFDFMKVEEIKNTDCSRIFEIDKLSVLESQRKNGVLDNIIKTIYEFALENEVEYFIALINPVLFRGLRIEYGLPAKSAGNMIRTEEYAIKPFFIDAKTLLKDLSWDKKNIISSKKEIKK